MSHERTDSRPAAGLNRVLYYVILGGLFLLPFIPLVVANNLFFPFITGKNFSFRIIVEIIFAAWVLLALRQAEYLPKKSFLLYGFAAFLVVMFVADLGSPNVYKSLWSNFERMEGYVTLVHLFALFLVASTVLTEKLWERLFQTSVGVSLYLFCYSVFQLTGAAAIHQGGVRTDATLGNATYLAVYMLFHIFISLLLVRFWYSSRAGGKELGRWSLYAGGAALAAILAAALFLFHPGAFQAFAPRGGFSPVAVSLFAILIWLVPIPLFACFRNGRKALFPLVLFSAIFAEAFVLYHTATRGATLGLLGGLFLAALLIAVFERKERGIRKAAIGIIAAVVVLVGGFFLVRNAPFMNASPVLQRFSSLSFTDKTAESRFMIWNMAWQGFKERPLLGWGQESFNYVFNKYYNPAMYSQEQWFDRTHNVVLDWLIAGGVLGLLAYLSLFAAALYYLWRKKSPFSFVEKSLITGLLAGYFAHNLTVFDNLTSYLLFLFILAWIEGRSGEQWRWLAAKTSRIEPGTLNRIIAPLVGAALVFVIYTVNVPPLLAAGTLIQALEGHPGSPADNLAYFKKALSYHSFGDAEVREQLGQSAVAAATANIDPNIRQQFFDLAYKEFSAQTAQTPEDARYFMFMGAFLDQYGQYDAAVSYLKKASALSPGKQTILFELGTAYLNKRDFSDALATMKRAFDLDQSFEEARRIYALAAIYAGQPKLAGELLAPLDPKSVWNDQRFLNAFVSVGLYSDALQGLDYLISEDPNNYQYYLDEAGIYLKMNNRARAIALIEKGTALNPAIKDQAAALINEIRAGKSF